MKKEKTVRSQKSGRPSDTHVVSVILGVACARFTFQTKPTERQTHPRVGSQDEINK